MHLPLLVAIRTRVYYPQLLCTPRALLQQLGHSLLRAEEEEEEEEEESKRGSDEVEERISFSLEDLTVS